MPTAPSESKAPRQRKKIPCNTLAIQIHDGFMFFMKRLEENNLEMTEVVIDKEKIIAQLTALKFEVQGKLSQYTSLDENKMRDEYEKCDNKSLEILPEVMDLFRDFFRDFTTYILVMARPSPLPSVKQIQDFLTTSFDFLSSTEERLREITGLNYEDYEIKENPAQPGIYFNPNPLWGGRRSKGWRRKTIRGRNKKTKRRRNKSMRLH